MVKNCDLELENAALGVRPRAQFFTIRTFHPANNFFSQASERAGSLNPRILLANHVLVIGPAFYNTTHGPEFFPGQRCTPVPSFRLLKVSGNRQSFACFTLPSA